MLKFLVALLLSLLYIIILTIFLNPKVEDKSTWWSMSTYERCLANYSGHANVKQCNVYLEEY